MFNFLKQHDRALKYSSGDLDFKEFKQFFHDAWMKNMDLLLLIHGISHIVEYFGIFILTFIFRQNTNKYEIILIIKNDTSAD